MKNLARLAILGVFAAAFPAAVFAEPPQAAVPTSPEQEGVLANDRAYEEAYAKGDHKALANFFATDADYTTEEGRTFSGREAIADALARGLAAAKGSKIVIVADAVRVLAPETVLEKGWTTVTSKSGESSSALFTAIHVKEDGKWKISQLIESPIADPTPAERLDELAWLVGKWAETDKSKDVKVSSQYVWARGGNFISRNVTVSRGGEVVLEGWEIIGWDPVEEAVRSWLFDGEGGFAEGRWTRSGDSWLVRQVGFGPDGSRTTAEITLTKLSEDRIAWESNNRTLDGEPQPGIDSIEVVRVKED